MPKKKAGRYGGAGLHATCETSAVQKLLNWKTTSGFLSPHLRAENSNICRTTLGSSSSRRRRHAAAAEGVQQSRTILKDANLLISKENTSLSTSYDVSERSEHTSSVLNGHLRSTTVKKKIERRKEGGRE